MCYWRFIYIVDNHIFAIDWIDWKAVNQRISFKYNLLRDLYEKPGECTLSITNLVKSVYLGKGYVEQRGVNHVEILDKFAIKSKPAFNVKFD